MKMKTIMTLASQAVFLLLTPFALAVDSSSITAIDVSNVSAEKQVVKISFNGVPPTPTSFAVNTPPRIAFDFANTTNQAGKNSVQVNGAALRLINVAEGTGRTRLVFNLQKPASYETKIENNALLVTVDGAAAMSTAKGAVPVASNAKFAEAKPSGKREGIQDIDFRRGTSGEGKVVIDLSSSNVGIDIRQQGKKLLVEFSKVALAKNLERSLDVSDFGTPIQKVDTFSQGDSVKMLIEPKGNWEYSAYQTENRFVVEVRDASEKTKTVQSKPNYKGEKLSLNFQSVEIRTVLQVIAEFTGLNIITSDTVNGALTLRLKDVPWDQALDIILQAKGLDQRKSGNVMWIAPRDELASKEKQELESKKQIAELEPTRTEYFALKYTKADDMKLVLTDEKQKLLSPRGSAVIVPRTNQVIVQDIPSKLEQIRELIAKTDIPVRQVMIEARIVEAEDGFSRNLGVKFHGIYNGRGDLAGASGGLTTKNYPIAVTDPVTGLPKADTYPGPALSGNTPSVNLPAAAIGGFNPGSIAMLLAGSDGLLGLELSALEQDGKGKIVSSPRLVTADQVEAVIEDGQEIPYSESSQNGATSVSFKKATLSLKVTPQITPDGNVFMDVAVNKDSRGENTLSGPAINTKQIKTKVLVENGGTVVIGGIYIEDTTNTVTQVPLLGDIPVMGNLFKNRSTAKAKRELLIFLTPRVLQSDLTLR
ncbi:type IV pilus secretin PilQ [Chitinibacter fontanus]|uniref:Type IV pilus biogenesis and competence protein PilQ n=1 Tax=Chitinibacter fontanus TaxID=1737446 RepID=A0A7D5ZDA2_9NEIS|nr:type IV pilus secretin PilQ [Chitinibacter fontanus]QLI81965.1 type IV pilus secretin PilQ [Chitinibacter fontanus]